LLECVLSAVPLAAIAAMQVVGCVGLQGNPSTESSTSGFFVISEILNSILV
jgi:hypothetical protein